MIILSTFICNANKKKMKQVNIFFFKLLCKHESRFFFIQPFIHIIIPAVFDIINIFNSLLRLFGLRTCKTRAYEY